MNEIHVEVAERRAVGLTRCLSRCYRIRDAHASDRKGPAYPTREHCSECGLCETEHVTRVRDACEFLGEGSVVHGRARKVSPDDEDRLGVVDGTFYAVTKQSVDGSQWTGLVTSVAKRMLESRMFEGVICVTSDPDGHRI
ncbi:hypothetical protein BE221DRAFT_46037, partial [Ostreococcus tauri]